VQTAGDFTGNVATTLNEGVKLFSSATAGRVGADGGLRTLERQKQLVAEGKSKTLKSKHLTGDAVDLYPLTNDAKAIAADRYNELARIVKTQAKRLGITIYWGFDLWGWDKVHYQLTK
jgi:hypothetical protein